ncbi:MAG: sigma-70 family RNA polymerase sigma factor [Myxococcales bacterium]|nr:sigma-70 family RNA polymerase sigma factor [Myxococcales bacterium]
MDEPHWSLDDQALVAAVIAERPGAWNAFFARFERLIISCVRKTLVRHGFPPREEDIEDLVSATALNLVRDGYYKLRAFDASRGYRLSSWVGMVATHTAFDMLRQRPAEVAPREGDKGPAQEVVAEGVDPSERVLRAEQTRLLQEAIAKLSPTEQLFVRYCFEDELEPEHIAQLMQISVNTVYSRKNRMREKLRRVIESMEPREEARGRPRNNRQE